MPRLRAAMQSEVDRELHGHLAKAIRELRMACDLCVRFSKDANRQAAEIRRLASEARKVQLPPELNDNLLRHQANLADRAARDLRQTLMILGRIGHLAPSVDVRDPDLVSEVMRSIQARIRKEESPKQGPSEDRYYELEEDEEYGTQ